MFPVNIAKFLTRVFYRTPVHYTFTKFYVMIEFFECLWIKNSHFSYFLCCCFVFVHNSITISIPLLFSPCFHTKTFSKSKFRADYNVGSSTILIKSLKSRNNSRITAKILYREPYIISLIAVTSPRNLLRILRICVFKILCFVIIFL